MIELLNIDCMEYMATCKDKAFDLAIVDPPFGIGQNWAKDTKGKFYKHRNNFNDSVPGKKYFKELFRVSRHQIIWGCNYYWNYLKPSNNLIFWDKGNDTFKQFGSAGELAWTSITKYPLVRVHLRWSGFITCEQEERIHPHQKPIKLYEWTLYHYAKGGGGRILDTHLGSASSAIAAHRGGYSFVGCERDPEYFLAAQKRFKESKMQMKMFQTQ